MNMDSKSFIGVYLDGKTLIVGRVRNGEIEKCVTVKVDYHASEDSIIQKVIEFVAQMIDDNVVGIGVGAPSVVDVEKGIVYEVRQISSWKEVHLKDILEGRFGMQVYVNNDANTFTVGEKYFGVATEYENIVGLILDIGVGAGIIFNGHLYSGTNCGAGELGLNPYKDHDFEYYCGEKYFNEKYGLESEVLYQRALNKDKIALAIYEQYGRDVGALIKTIMFNFDPEVVVLGGSCSKAFNFFEEEMNKVIRTFTYSHSLNNFRVLKSKNESIAVLGAVALFYDANNMTIYK